MRSLAELTPAEVDRRVIASRRLLFECRAMPTPENVARMETEVGLLSELQDLAPSAKAEKISRLIAAYRATMPKRKP